MTFIKKKKMKDFIERETQNYKTEGRLASSLRISLTQGAVAYKRQTDFFFLLNMQSLNNYIQQKNYAIFYVANEILL